VYRSLAEFQKALSVRVEAEGNLFGGAVSFSASASYDKKTDSKTRIFKAVREVKTDLYEGNLLLFCCVVFFDLLSFFSACVFANHFPETHSHLPHIKLDCLLFLGRIRSKSAPFSVIFLSSFAKKSFSF
jgi:hypothetical protein